MAANANRKPRLASHASQYAHHRPQQTLFGSNNLILATNQGLLWACMAVPSLNQASMNLSIAMRHPQQTLAANRSLLCVMAAPANKPCTVHI